MKEIDKKTDYDLGWEIWDQMKINGPASRHTRRLVFNCLKGLDFKSVLDVGCGNGLLLFFFNKKHIVSDLHGLDISHKAVEIAKHNLPHGNFYVKDISKEAANVKADLVLCCDVLEHIEDYKAALANIKKMAAKFFLLTTVQGRMRPFEKNIGHVRNFEKSGLLQDLNDTGFKVVKVIEWGFPFYSPLYRWLFNCKRVEGFSYGEYGFFKKLVSSIIYYLFYFNLSSYGDNLIILCKGG